LQPSPPPSRLGGNEGRNPWQDPTDHPRDHRERDEDETCRDLIVARHRRADRGEIDRDERRAEMRECRYDDRAGAAKARIGT